MFEKDVHEGSPEQDYGTYTWATEMGFSEAAAKAIGESNNDVDSGDTSPFATPWNDNRLGRSRHFDIPLGGADSRIGWARIEMKNAIAAWKRGDKLEAYKALGRGLHSVQDRIAHLGWDNDHCPYTYHGQGWQNSGGVDNWKWRGSSTQKRVEEATKDYLREFLDATKE